MGKKLIVAADRTRARIYKERPFALLKTLDNELGREKNRAMTTDKPGMGRTDFSKSATMHSLTGEKNPHDEAADQFARRISHYLEHESGEHHFDKLVIAAEPRMLGKIRGSLSEAIKSKCEWMNKDFGHFSDYEVGKDLHLNPPRAGTTGACIQFRD